MRVAWEDHVRLWLRAGLSGCEFARRLAGKADRVVVELYADATVPSTTKLNKALDAHAAAERTVIVVFPLVVDEQQLVDLLATLLTDTRWRVRDGGKTSPSGGAIVGLEWTTSAGDISDVMGLGPFATMPVPRRTPHVALAIWPGARCNPFRGSGPTPPAHAKRVSFLDASHGFALSDYEELYRVTSEQVGNLMTVPPDDASLYRRAGFVLSADGIAKLRTAVRAVKPPGG
jgi:hypothetical protein